MAAIYSYQRTVQENEVEPDGYVSCLTYLLWTRSAATEHSASERWPSERYEKEGIAWVVRSHNIRYLQPAYGGQDVIVQTWVSYFRKTNALRKYRILRASDNALLVTAETEWTLVDKNKRRPCRIPVELSTAFQLLPEGAEPPMERNRDDRPQAIEQPAAVSEI